MRIIGLVAEYNPFHNGHLYQINEIKKIYQDSIIIAVLATSFTQRGEISVLNKWDKTKIALDNGIDIVLELPFVYAVQSSDVFAKGAISILEKLKIDTLVFGTESLSIEKIKQAATFQLNNKEYDKRLKEYLNKGISYPTAANKAIEDLIGVRIDSPNDLLALSYIKQIMLSNKKIEIKNIPRTNNYHSTKIKGNIASATAIRKRFLNGKKIDKLIPYSEKYLYKVAMNNYFPYLKYKILLEDKMIRKYQTVDEGIENRILKNIEFAENYTDLIMKVKTKRYTYNKISRMLLHILIGLTKESVRQLDIDYLRILGFSKKGQEYLNKIKKQITIPIITSYKKNISKILNIELVATKTYSLETDSNLIKREYEKRPIITRYK